MSSVCARTPPTAANSVTQIGFLYLAHVFSIVALSWVKLPYGCTVTKATLAHAPRGSALTYSSIHAYGSPPSMYRLPSLAGQGLPSRALGYQYSRSSAAAHWAAATWGDMSPCSLWLGSLKSSTWGSWSSTSSS